LTVSPFDGQLIRAFMIGGMNPNDNGVVSVDTSNILRAKF
jgi:hypothetical protein